MLCRCALFALFATVVSDAYVGIPTAVAKDHFLTIGGGYGTVGNQLSLERNVAFQQAVLAEKRPDKPQHDVYFADGDDDSRDLQCRDADYTKKCTAARQMMAALFGDAYAKDLYYRNHELPNVRGATERSAVRRRMRELARELHAGDRLIVYVTGHGGPAKRPYDEYDEDGDDSGNKKTETPYNKFDTSFNLWNSEAVTASEFTKWLDRFDPDVVVVLVMVQCYAGGFAHTIFQQADEDLGLSVHNRCGFFGQMHDRGAAGCNPDANEADYEEYSSYFWAALRGKSRSGKPITSADYDGDGQISFAEAHCYAVIESDTIDIPVRTSSALLAKYSHLGKAKNSADDGTDSGNVLGKVFGLLESTAKPADAAKPIVELKGSFKALAAIARPDQRAILEQLPTKLGLGDSPTIESVKLRLSQVESNHNVASAEVALAHRAYTTALDRAQEEVREIWPELQAAGTPLSMELAGERSAEFSEQVRKLASYQTLLSATDRYKQASEKQLKVARTEARLQRLVATCEDVVRAKNLPLAAPAEIVARYEKLVALEQGKLVE